MGRFVVLWTGMAALLPSCEFLTQLQANSAQVGAAVKPLMPTVTYQDAVLAESPSQRMMAAYYCPIVVLGPQIVRAAACQAAFGPAPAASHMRVSFDLRFVVKNPNQFPIPVAELLTAAMVFPDKTQQSLGAACVTFCGKDQPGCTGQPGPQSCQSRTGDIKDLDDFKTAVAQFVVAQGIVLLAGGQPTFQMPEVVQDSELIVTARFSFGPDALLGVLKQVAQNSVSLLQQGQELTFAIPYRLEGTVWLDVGSLGRVEVGFGPASGTWVVPTSTLVPK
jgi:hypothetical protein